MTPCLTTGLPYSLYSQKERKRKAKSLSRVRLFETPWTVAYQAPPSMGFSRQEYWSGVPFPSPGDLPDPGIRPGCPALHADALPSEPPEKPLQPKMTYELTCSVGMELYYPSCGQVAEKPSPLSVKFPPPWFLSLLLLLCPVYPPTAPFLSFGGFLPLLDPKM